MVDKMKDVLKSTIHTHLVCNDSDDPYHTMSLIPPAEFCAQKLHPCQLCNDPSKIYISADHLHCHLVSHCTSKCCECAWSLSCSYLCKHWSSPQLNSSPTSALPTKLATDLSTVPIPTVQAKHLYPCRECNTVDTLYVHESGLHNHQKSKHPTGWPQSNPDILQDIFPSSQWPESLQWLQNVSNTLPPSDTTAIQTYAIKIDPKYTHLFQTALSSTGCYSWSWCRPMLGSFIWSIFCSTLETDSSVSGSYVLSLLWEIKHDMVQVHCTLITVVLWREHWVALPPCFSDLLLSFY